MEVRFGQQEQPCLDTVLREGRSQEFTQELRLPEGFPDIGQVLCAWGQCLLRGKEWNSGDVSVSGGMMVWVLYIPEDGTGEQCVEGWIPFQTKWDLPEACPEGTLRVRCLTRFVDARSVTPRKLMVRAGIGTLAEAFVPGTLPLQTPEELPDTVEWKNSTWPVRLGMEAGEKSFTLDEELALPGSVPVPEKLIFSSLDPRVTESRIVGNQLVFRGSGNLHILYRSREGQLHGWEFDLPFSQLAELNQEYGTDSRADILLAPTVLETELTEEGRIRLRGSMTGQYLVTDRKPLTLVEDAYGPGRKTELSRVRLEVPAILENRRETLQGEQTIPAEADVVAEVTFLPDLPRQRRTEEGLEITVPGQFQVLYYGPDGGLHAGTARWEGTLFLGADRDASLWISPVPGELAKASLLPGQLSVNCQVPLEVTAFARQGIPMVTSVSLGEPEPKRADRPSLLLRRAGQQGLWETAKAAGTTVDAVKRINGLTEEPAPDRLLLIPVP